MKKTFFKHRGSRISNTPSKSQKVTRLAKWTIYIALLLRLAYEIYLHNTTGRPMPNLIFYILLLSAPAQIYNILAYRNSHKGNSTELKRFDHMILRNILLAVVIVFVFVVISVLRAIHMFSH